MSLKHWIWIDERLAKERREREARELSWSVVEAVLARVCKEDVTLESNPLHLGERGSSYLEQVEILFPEVQPGYGEAMLNAVQMLVELLKTRTRDLMTDEERVAVGWADDPYLFECRACKRRVESPCNDRGGFQENGPWDSSCRQILYPEEFIS